MICAILCSALKEMVRSLTGIGEVVRHARYAPSYKLTIRQVLLPLDVLKIKMQTNPDAVRGRSFFKLLSDEGLGSLYRGWGWTMARNAPGSFAVSGNMLVTSMERLNTVVPSCSADLL